MGFSEKEQLCVLEKEGRDYVLLSVACPASSALALPSEHSEVLCSDDRGWKTKTLTPIMLLTLRNLEISLAFLFLSVFPGNFPEGVGSL